MSEDRIKAWHFVAADRRLGYGDNRKIRKGGILRYTDDLLPALCQQGLHASRHPFDALNYARGPILCRVEVWGDVSEDDDKLVGRNRKVIDWVDFSSELRLFACWSVRKVWHLVTDERSREAIRVAERYAKGEATKEEWDAARDAAWAAAQAAAASRDAAWAAALDAARDAAWAAAWAAARAAQRKRFARICSSAMRREK